MLVVDTQRVDREQVEANWWFGRLRSQLLREIEWADLADAEIPYRLTALGIVEGAGRTLVMRGMDDFLDLADR